MNSVSFSGIIRFLCAIGFLGLSALRADPTVYGITYAADPFFKPAIEHVGYINAVALSRTLVMAGTPLAPTYPLDGKYYAGGSFTKVGSQTSAYFVRYNADATVDTTFNIGTGFDDQVRAVVVQSDGKILVGGDFTSFNGNVCGRIVRLLANGTIDPTFVPSIGFNGSVRSLAMREVDQNNLPIPRTIVVGGSFTSFTSGSPSVTVTQNYIARLKDDGKLDAEFNKITTGTNANVGTGFDALVNALAIQSDGKIVVGGAFVTFNAVGMNRIARLNTDGTLDSAFTTAIGSGFDGPVNALGVQKDGLIVVGGSFSSFNGTATYNITRLGTTGAIDTTFYNGSGTNNSVYTIGFQMVGATPTQHILAGGIFTSFNGGTYRGIIRMNTDGRLDGPYELDSSGNVVTTTDSAGATINKINNDWFNPGLGFNSNVFSLVSDVPVGQTATTPSRIIAGGIFSSFDGFAARGLVRTLKNGAPDVASSSDLRRESAVRFAQQIKDGKFIVAGSFTLVNQKSLYFVTRLDSQGLVDTSFYRGTGFSGNGVNAALVDTTDVTSGIVNSILLGGSFTVFNGATENYIARLYSDGSLQAVSSTAARSTTFTDAAGTVTTTTWVPDGIVLNGKTTKTVVTTTKDGVSTTDTTTIDTTGDLLVWFNPGTGFDASVNALAFQSVVAGTVTTDYILAGGAFTTLNGAAVGHIARLAKTDGTPDTTFTTAAGTGFDASVNAIAVQPMVVAPAVDQRILVGGEFLKFNDATSTSCKYVARLNAGGSLDTTFTAPAALDGAVKAIVVKADVPVVQANVRIYLGGKFTGGIMRLLADGTKDTSFVTGTGFKTLTLPAEIEAITVQGDGMVIVTGDFDSYNGAPVSGVARLKTDGSLDTAFSLPDVTDHFAYGVAFTSEVTPRLLLSGASATGQVGLAVLRPNGYVLPTSSSSSSSSGAAPVSAAASAAPTEGGGGAPSGLYFALVGIAAFARFVNRRRQKA